MSLARTRQIIAQILLRKYEESRQRRWELAWQTRTLAQFISAAAPIEGENALLKVADKISLEMDFEKKAERGNSPHHFLESPDDGMPIVATPTGTPVRQDPSLLELEGDDLKALFESNIQIDADAIPEGSFEQLVPDHVRFAMARDQAFAAAAEASSKKNEADS